jgi:hypothetical protein
VTVTVRIGFSTDDVRAIAKLHGSACEGPSRRLPTWRKQQSPHCGASSMAHEGCMDSVEQRAQINAGVFALKTMAALGYWVKEGWHRLLIFLYNVVKNQ